MNRSWEAGGVERCASDKSQLQSIWGGHAKERETRGLRNPIMPETPENHKPDRNDKPALAHGWEESDSHGRLLQHCLNLAVLVNSSQARGPFLLWRWGPSWFSLPQAMCVHWAPAHWSELSPCISHLYSLLLSASGNNVLLSIFYLKHLDSQLLFFNCGDWTSPNYYLVLQTHLSDYTVIITPKACRKETKVTWV